MSRLSGSPLELVICQIRFEARPEVSGAEFGFQFHEALGGEGGRYPRLDPIQHQNLELNVTEDAEPQVKTTTRQTGWTMKSADGDWGVTVVPDHVAIETSAYTTWDDDFEPRLREVIAAVAGVLKPALTQRIGLRYVDRITELELDSVQDWKDYICPELLGPALHEGFGEAVRATHQTIGLEVDPGVMATMQHGAIRSDEGKKVDYVLDYDIARTQSRRFDEGALMEDAIAFNRIALQLFQASVEDALRDKLR